MSTDTIARGLAAQAKATLAASGPKLRTTPLRVALFGDSTASPGDVTPAGSQDASTVIVPNWQSGTVVLSQYNSKWTTAGQYPPAFLVGNGGISGQTTASMVARDTLATSTTRRAVQDMLNLDPDVVIYRGGSINDFSALTASNQVSAAVATAYANATEVVARFASAGVPVLNVGIYGYSGDGIMYPTADSPSVRQAIVAQNANLKALAGQFPNCKYVDPVGVVADAAGNYLSSNFYGTAGSDTGVHLSTLGSHLMAQAEANALVSLFGQPGNIRYRGINVATNPLLTASSTQSYGPLATGYSLGGTNYNLANTKIETILGKKMQTGEWTASASGAASLITLPFDPSAATGFNPALGDTYGVEFDYYCAPLNGAFLATELHRLDVRDSVGSGRVVVDRGGSYTFTVAQPMMRHIVFPPLKFGDSGANLTTSSLIVVGLQGIASGVQFKAGVGNLRIVKQ